MVFTIMQFTRLILLRRRPHKFTTFTRLVTINTVVIGLLEKVLLLLQRVTICLLSIRSRTLMVLLYWFN